MPTCTLPKLTLGGVKAIVPGVTAVPVTATARFGFVAVETMARLPVTVPATVGAKVTWKVELWPAARTSGKARPLMLTPGPVADACEMVALVPPEFVRVTAWFCGLPTVTFPKATVVGETVSCPAEVPLPARGKEAVVDVEEGPEEPEAALMLSEALPVTAMLPLADPEDLGAKVTVKFVL